jgi:V/A-type H+/Na+-transporting ATPase subunit F
MKAFIISDNVDTSVGLQIAGIKSVVLHDRENIIKKLEELTLDREVGIIIFTEKAAALVQDKIGEIKMTSLTPLIVEIPDRHGTMKTEASILNYVKESIGVKI